MQSSSSNEKLSYFNLILIISQNYIYSVMEKLEVRILILNNTYQYSSSSYCAYQEDLYFRQWNETKYDQSQDPKECQQY